MRRVAGGVLMLVALPWSLGGQEAVLPSDDQLDPDDLVPHRLRLDLGDFAADVFDTPQVYISLERTHHYRDGEARRAIRVRWVANTHPHEDEVLLDEATMSVVQAESLGGTIRDRSRVMAFLREDSVTSVHFDETGGTETTTAAWAAGERAYHLMMLPYWFAALTAEPGDRYVLPQFAARTGARSTIDVEVVGPARESGVGDEAGDPWSYRSDHGWVRIDWTIDRSAPPYLRRMVWHYRGGPRDGVVSPQDVVEWHVFQGDVFRDVIR